MATQDDLKARARRIAQEMFTQGDLAVADEVFAAGCRHHLTGEVGMAQWITALRRAFPDLCATIADEVAEGDTVMQRLALAGTHRGPLLGIPPCGRRARWQVAMVLHAGPAGAFAEHWSIWDPLDLLRQLGGPPPAWQGRSRGHRQTRTRSRRVSHQVLEGEAP